MELLPCPFCGCKEVEYYNGWKKGSRKCDDSYGRNPSICCDECGIGFSVGYFGYGISDKKAKKDTYEAWNKRVK